MEYFFKLIFFSCWKSNDFVITPSSSTIRRVYTVFYIQSDIVVIVLFWFDLIASNMQKYKPINSMSLAVLYISIVTVWTEFRLSYLFTMDQLPLSFFLSFWIKFSKVTNNTFRNELFPGYDGIISKIFHRYLNWTGMVLCFLFFFNFNSLEIFSATIFYIVFNQSWNLKSFTIPDLTIGFFRKETANYVQFTDFEITFNLFIQLKYDFLFVSLFLKIFGLKFRISMWSK